MWHKLRDKDGFMCVFGGVGGLKGALKVIGGKLSCKKGNMEYQCSLGV